MRRTLAITLAAAVAVGALMPLASCASTASSEEVTVGADMIVLDVRTPEEYASGHLDGAVLLDMNAGQVAASIPTLDPDAEYLVYCRSGNRAGQAIALMEQAGFTDLTNLGSLEDAAAATGVPIVR